MNTARAKIMRLGFGKTSDWRAIGSEARILLEKKLYKQARVKIQQALALAPTKSRILLVAHDIYRESGDLDQSLEFAFELVRHCPKKIEGYILVVKDLVELRRIAEAQKWISKGLRRFPNKQVLLNMRAELQLVRDESIVFAMPKAILIPHEDLGDFVRKNGCSSVMSNAPGCLVSRHLGEVDLDPFNEPGLFHCENALVTKNYGVHDLAGNPFYGTVLARQKFVNDGQKCAKYPLGYPSKIITPRTADIDCIPFAFYVHNALSDHFGHLLTEVLSSIYPLLFWKSLGLAVEDIPIIVPLNQNNSQGLRFNGLLRSLGVSSSDFLVPGIGRGNLFVRDLFVAKPTVSLGGFASSYHPVVARQFLQLRLNRECEKVSNGIRPEKIFISRSKLPGDARAISGVSELEKFLEESGWYIFHPQCFALEEQVEIYEGARFLCAMPGSALHLLYGLELASLQRLVLLTHQGKYCNNAINYFMQFEAQSIEYVALECLTSEDTNSGVGECFTDQKIRELRLGFREDVSLRDLALRINQICR